MHLKLNIADNQGNAWKLAEVNIPDIRDEYALAIEAVVGTGREGDIAIDDVKLWEGDCSRGRFSIFLVYFLKTACQVALFFYSLFLKLPIQV